MDLYAEVSSPRKMLVMQLNASFDLLLLLLSYARYQDRVKRPLSRQAHSGTRRSSRSNSVQRHRWTSEATAQTCVRACVQTGWTW